MQKSQRAHFNPATLMTHTEGCNIANKIHNNTLSHDQSSYSYYFQHDQSVHL